MFDFTYNSIHGTFIVFAYDTQRPSVSEVLPPCPPPHPPYSNFIAGRPKETLLFYSLVILDVVCRVYLSLFLLYIYIEISKTRC